MLLLAVALLLTGFIYALATSGKATANDSAEDIEAGRALFLANCATCHGLNAEGRGEYPSLIGVGSAAVNFQVGTGRMPMQASGPQAPVKPAQISAEGTRQLAAYISSLGPGPQTPTEEMVDPTLGDPSNGAAIFRTNCAMCHNAVGAGGALSQGKYAPPLYDTTPTHIYEAMLTGPQSMPVFNDQTITPEEKRDVIAYLVEQREPSPGGNSLGSLGPVSEGLWIWIIGIGSLIGFAVWIGAKST